MEHRIGQGYDVHRLVAGRRLVIGGEEIPFDKGLEGHSDADVLLHAIADAMLGALGLGDIGSHFPPDDPKWLDADSCDLLARVGALIQEQGYRVVNCDATVIAEAPKLLPYRDRIQSRIAGILGIDKGLVSVKATTHETLGPIGRGEGIAAMAVVLLARS